MSGKSAREERRQERLQQENEIAAQEKRKRLLQIGSAAVFLAVIGVVVLIVVSGSESGGGEVSRQDVSEINKELAGIPQKGLIIGRPQAKVTLIEYGDLQCPVCKGYAAEVLPAVISSKVRTGEARLEFRNFRIISQESVDAGAAAIAAGRQGRGWTYIELFYRNQGLERSGYVTDAFMTEIAKAAGVSDLQQWNRDRHSKAIIAEVSRTTQEAQHLGFNGTPSFAVEGPRTGGIETLGTVDGAALERAIEEAG